MLSLNGFKVHLNNVTHYTDMFHYHKAIHFLKPVDDSKQVLINAFIEQQNEIERLQEELRNSVKVSYGGKLQVGRERD